MSWQMDTVHPINDTDRALPTLLRGDACNPVATLAHQWRVPRSTVQNRLRKRAQVA